MTGSVGFHTLLSRLSRRQEYLSIAPHPFVLCLQQFTILFLCRPISPHSVWTYTTVLIYPTNAPWRGSSTLHSSLDFCSTSVETFVPFPLLLYRPYTQELQIRLPLCLPSVLITLSVYRLFFNLTVFRLTTTLAIIGTHQNKMHTTVHSFYFVGRNLNLDTLEIDSMSGYFCFNILLYDDTINLRTEDYHS